MAKCRVPPCPGAWDLGPVLRQGIVEPLLPLNRQCSAVLSVELFALLKLKKFSPSWEFKDIKCVVFHTRSLFVSVTVVKGESIIVMKGL